MNKTSNSEKYRAFLAHIKASREQQGLTVRDLAKIIDENHPIVHRIETGERKLTVQEFIEYCIALKLDPKHCLDLLI